MIEPEINIILMFLLTHPITIDIFRFIICPVIVLRHVARYSKHIELFRQNLGKTGGVFVDGNYFCESIKVIDEKGNPRVKLGKLD